MSECLFCKIVDGSIPSTKVYEDEHVYAFTDIMPVAKGHTLLIPKTHCQDIFEMSEETAKNLYAAAPKVANAIKAAFNPIGMNTINNNGAAAGQTVFHYHLHFIPRYDESEGLQVDWQTLKYTSEQLTEVAEQIKANL
ncbi:MAG: HIT family protein [Lysinibacillus sp.]